MSRLLNLCAQRHNYFRDLISNGNYFRDQSYSDWPPESKRPISTAIHGLISSCNYLRDQSYSNWSLESKRPISNNLSQGSKPFWHNFRIKAIHFTQSIQGMNAKPIPPNLDLIQQSRSRYKVHLTPPTGIQGVNPHANLSFTKGSPKCYQLPTGMRTKEILIPRMTLKAGRSIDKKSRCDMTCKWREPDGFRTNRHQTGTCWESMTVDSSWTRTRGKQWVHRVMITWQEIQPTRTSTTHNHTATTWTN